MWRLDAIRGSRVKQTEGPLHSIIRQSRLHRQEQRTKSMHGSGAMTFFFLPTSALFVSFPHSHSHMCGQSIEQNALFGKRLRIANWEGLVLSENSGKNMKSAFWRLPWVLGKLDTLLCILVYRKNNAQPGAQPTRLTFSRPLLFTNERTNIPPVESNRLVWLVLCDVFVMYGRVRREKEVLRMEIEEMGWWLRETVNPPLFSFMVNKICF